MAITPQNDDVDCAPTVQGDAAAEIAQQLLIEGYKNLTAILAVTAVTAIAAACVLAGQGFVWAFAWVGVLLALTVVRFGGQVAFRRALAAGPALSKAQVSGWKRAYAFGLHASGALWVWGAAPTMAGESPAQYAMIIIMSALAGGGSGAVAPMLRDGRIYICTMLLPASTMLMLADVPHIIGFLGYVFTAAMLVVHTNNHRVIRNSIGLQLHNNALVRELRILNSELETKVADRTASLKRVANTDNLTGLPNRRALVEWMQRHLEEEADGDAAVLFLDLDRFKQINDAMGHEVGDQVLQSVALRLNEALPDNAILARWGGDEFIAVLPKAVDARGPAERLAARLVDAVTVPIVAEGQQLGLGLSVGLAYFPADAATAEDAILAADLAVAEAKRTGRGKAICFHEIYAQTQKRRFDLGRALGLAIEQGGLELHYQPIVSAATGETVSREALARWLHPQMGRIDPSEFVQLAEDTDRIVALGDWVLRRACQDAARWSGVSGPPRVAVNVAVKQLLREGFAQRVLQVLTETGLAPGRLELEVTESVFDDQHLEAVLRCAHELSGLGVRLHVDDFGKGYSSLSRLHQFPVHAIKIDKSFVDRIQRGTCVVIESTLMIARRFGMDVVAEGVETREQADALSRMGVTFLQGYYFGRPAPLTKAVPAPALVPAAAAAGSR